MQCFMLFLFTAFALMPTVSAMHIPVVKGYEVNGELLCNGLPLIGAVEMVEQIRNCSRVVLHLNIPDRETTLEMLEPFASWNATFHISCGQVESLFVPGQQPVITFIHNCPLPSLNNDTSTPVPMPQESAECRKWEVEVPEENIGSWRRVKPLELGTQELSGLGEQVPCQKLFPEEDDDESNEDQA